MVTLREFMSGEPLKYVATNKKRCEVKYLRDDGELVISCDRLAEKIPADDVGARRVYWNLRGGKDGSR